MRRLKPDKELLLTSIFVGILISGLGVVMAVFTQKLLDKILPSGDVRVLRNFRDPRLYTVVCKSFTLCNKTVHLVVTGKSYNIRIVDGFYNSLLELPKPFFDTRKTGDMVARLNDTMRIQTGNFRFSQHLYH